MAAPNSFNNNSKNQTARGSPSSITTNSFSSPQAPWTSFSDEASNTDSNNNNPSSNEQPTPGRAYIPIIPAAGTNPLSVLRALDLPARRALLASPPIQIFLAYVQGFIVAPSALLTTYSPFIRARLADWRQQQIQILPPGAPISSFPKELTLPYMHPQAVAHLISYMQNSCTVLNDPLLVPSPSPLNTILLYHAILVLQLPFSAKKFQAEIMDFWSRSAFGVEEVRACWVYLRGVEGGLGEDQKIIKHLVANLAYERAAEEDKGEEGGVPRNSAVDVFVNSEEELKRMVEDAQRGLKVGGRNTTRKRRS